ncbi:hypothetical protein EVAR_11006_1 [Eumeta japonica]|uniref:Uncharacterized protein n=1 Tax=Eumeta variegata TaxID=151549 RepID=A0A4C1YLL5_EUMVA|nr:hypothetical protein EVAR_11006_1 [Eumeta japonica]
MYDLASLMVILAVGSPPRYFETKALVSMYTGRGRGGDGELLDRDSCFGVEVVHGQATRCTYLFRPGASDFGARYSEKHLFRIAERELSRRPNAATATAVSTVPLSTRWTRARVEQRTAMLAVAGEN